MQCDKNTEQFTDFTDSHLKLYPEKFRCFDSSTKDLDEFYFNDIDLQSFKELSFLVKIILTLSHGQASAEKISRGGSRAAAISKMERFTIITKRSILDVAAAPDPPLLTGS